MRRFILILLMLLYHPPITATAGTSSESETVQLVAIEHDELTDPRTGARLVPRAGSGQHLGFLSSTH